MFAVFYFNRSRSHIDKQRLKASRTCTLNLSQSEIPNQSICPDFFGIGWTEAHWLNIIMQPISFFFVNRSPNVKYRMSGALTLQ